MAFHQQTALDLAVLSQLVDVLHVLYCLVILDSCLCAAAVDLDIVEMAVADPACEEGAADFGLRDEAMEVKVGELVG